MRDDQPIKVSAKDGPIFVSPCSGGVSLGVYLMNAHVHTYLTPHETTSLIAALRDTLQVVVGGGKGVTP